MNGSIYRSRDDLLKAVHEAEVKLDAAWVAYRADCQKAFDEYILRPFSYQFDGPRLDIREPVSIRGWNEAYIELLKAKIALADGSIS